MAKTINTGFITDKINGIAINTSLKCSSSNYNNSSSRSISYIVMHYTGNSKDTAWANANYFNTGSRGSSAHFFVDNKNIYQSIELRDIAWHCGTDGTYYHNACRNINSIGIEMCCTAGNYKISETTKKNAAYLCAHLCKMLGIAANEVDTYVLRHYDVTHKECPKQMKGSNNSEWKAFKTMVKNILNTGSVTAPTTTTTTTTTATATFATGAKLNLSKIALYASSSAKNKSSTKTGTFYVWSATPVNNRVRITNSAANVGKSGQVTGWIGVDDAKKCVVGASVSTFASYKVQVTTDVLNIRAGVGTGFKVVGQIKDRGVYTIVDEGTTSNGVKWGLLKSYVDNRNGWISLSYTKKV